MKYWENINFYFFVNSSCPIRIFVCRADVAGSVVPSQKNPNGAFAMKPRSKKSKKRKKNTDNLCALGKMRAYNFSFSCAVQKKVHLR